MVLENSLNLILTNGQEPCVLRGTCLRCKEVCVFTDPNVDTTREVSAAGDEEDVMESAPSHSGTDTNSASAHTSTARVSSQCRIYLWNAISVPLPHFTLVAKKFYCHMLLTLF